ncbi:acyl-CoA N-acyltransferase [Hypoxylon trugodes]|uniref:acyl-CoA N-acyltransferase n=1 Tax=Hypoxylon trugodes TaxID=326681 RepID=UPI0021942875|nr:acyl-CoA N-acyltransferase [Hypoxylon trugodes]KAI1390107.1 acyl-CoA N-acyltransferase [Hypoxylon trugodes]
MTTKVPSVVAASELPAKSGYEVVIGDALVSDAPAIALIGTKTFTTSFGFAVPPDDLAVFLAETYSAKAVEADLSTSHETKINTFVARDETGKVLGFVQLVGGHTDPSIEGDPSTHAELRRLYVDTSAHGRGIGSKLIAAVEAKARADGVKTLWLTVWENAADAQRLYYKLGYKKVGEAGFFLGGCTHNDHVLAKPL